MFKNAKSFVIFGSAIQPRCDKHLYLCQLIIGTYAENRKVTDGQVQLLFSWPPLGRTASFRKIGQQRGYELNWDTNWAVNPGPVRLVYRYTAWNWLFLNICTEMTAKC